MFASNALVHLVFADPMDEYYSDGLLTLDLNRYLWLKLHERFSTVYFLRAGDHGFQVSTLGDKKAKLYEPNQGFLKSMKDIFGGKSETQRFGAWMLEQMRAMRSEAAAFVCPAEDFCRIAAGPDWAAQLRQLAGEKNRTGILVLTMPLEAERSRELLMEEGAFAQLGDAAISYLRGGSLQDLFPALVNGKKDACSVLSPCSGVLLHEILLRIQLENPQRQLTEEESRAAEAYLRRYLRDLHLQQSEPLLRIGEPALYLSHRDLYLQLKNEQVWNELRQRARNQNRLSEGKLMPAASLPLDRNGITGRCAAKLYSEGMSSSAAANGPKIPERILMKLLTVRNCRENQTVAEALEDFLLKLSSANREDTETSQKLVEAIGFCTDWLYVPEKSEEEKLVLALVERQKVNLELSSLNFLTREKLSSALQTGGGILDVKLRQMQAQAESVRRTAEQYQQLISSSMLDLSLSSFSPREVFDKLGKLEDTLRELRPEEEPAAETETPMPAWLSEEEKPPEQEPPQEPPQEPAQIPDEEVFAKLSREQWNKLFEIE